MYLVFALCFLTIGIVSIRKENKTTKTIGYILFVAAILNLILHFTKQ